VPHVSEGAEEPSLEEVQNVTDEEIRSMEELSYKREAGEMQV
jgi:hypothetical protein